MISNSYVDPVTLSFIRFILGGLILMILAGILYKGRLFSVKIKDIGYMCILAFCGISAQSILLFFGQKYTTSINSSLILQLSPLMIAALGVFIGEKLRLKKIAGLIVSLAGCLIAVEVITPGGIAFSLQNGFGDILVFSAAFFWTIYVIMAKGIVLKYGGIITTAWVMFLGAIELLFAKVLLPVQTIFVQNTFTWGIILYIAIFPTAIAYFAWNEASDKISLSLLNIMQYLTPLFTISLAVLLLNESFKLNHVLGILIIFGGIYISEYSKPLKNKG